ncbi:Glycine-rich RNA-binding protein 2, mitochondrial-like protein [Mycena indigotica]|uniref:Glycine-rich RNA-binding protein 2, mitochondrial-like protein n=1 Tax=Mycena indigotica TaxID=2126181 RepID=A0A8H6VS24_9AGAR|nr:Glycine-rich RNA-binding protein 2, mitochondrial-like protein [Mycena indigotica]KAF7289936.1 Glycine-rich RNA-binding protein 2, mitochondrial-like protein [Mycena indigotica]
MSFLFLANRTFSNWLLRHIETLVLLRLLIMSKLHIGNLSYGINDEMLYEVFIQYGPLTEWFVVKRDGRSCGFGFVTFDAEEDARYAIRKLDGQELNGRSLRVSIANSQTSVRGARGEKKVQANENPFDTRRGHYV